MTSRLVKLELKPGVVTNDTGLANEGGYSAANLVRAYQGRVQPVGGWELRTTNVFEGIARGSHAWSTRMGDKCLAFGTNTALYGEFNGNIRDITGPLHETVLENAFSTTNGSNVVTVKLVFHNLRVEQEVTFSNHQSTVGGLTIQGTYEVKEILTRDTFTIEAGSNASSTVTNGGGFVDFLANLPAGAVSNDIYGYGTRGYGEGEYGSSLETDELRTWAIDNWGEFGLFNPSGYGLWEWQPLKRYVDLAFNGTFNGNANGWGLGTGWAYNTNKVTKTAGTASNLSQNVEGILEGGKTYRVIFTVTRTAGTLKFRVNAGDPPAVIDVGYASSPITKSGTYSRIFRCPADPSDIIFEGDDTFAGSVSNVSYQVEDKAYRITTAPPIIDYMYVDPNGLVVALGTTTVDDGQYDPTLMRCSDLGNNRAWVPDTDSYASFRNLRGIGGRLMSGLPTRQQALAWGDDGVGSLQFTGELGDAFAFELLGVGCGIASRDARSEQNGFVFWASKDNFFIFRGIGATNLGYPEIIPCSVSEDLFNNIDESQLLKCHVGIVPRFSEMWFFYPDTRDGDECSRAVTFNWVEGHWHPHIIERTTWCDSGIFPSPIGFSPEGYIFNHEVGTTANGGYMGWFAETSDLDIQDGDNLLLVMGFVPDFADQQGSIALTLKGKFYPNDANWVEKGPFTSSPSTRRLNFRMKARQVRFRFAEGTRGSFVRQGASRIDLGGTQAKR